MGEWVCEYLLKTKSTKKVNGIFPKIKVTVLHGKIGVEINRKK